MSDQDTRKPRSGSINPSRTTLTLSLGAVLTIGLAGWNARAYFDEFRAEQKNAFAALKASIDDTHRALHGRIDINSAAITVLNRDRLTTPELRLWAYQLERENRDVQRANGRTGLVVPEPNRQP